MKRVIATILCLVLASACGETTTQSLFDETLTSLRADASASRAARQGNSRRLIGSDVTPRGSVAEVGSGTFVSARAPLVTTTQLNDGQQGYTLNLFNAPIAQAAKSVLGDILQVSYTIDPRVQGNMTIQTSQPVDRDALVELFETSLAIAGAAVVRQGAGYQIVPAAAAARTTPPVSIPAVAPSGPGVGIQVITLNHIGAREMQTILEPITPEGAILRVDEKRNHIIVAGNPRQLAAVQDSIEVFDVDWMRGRSVAIHPLERAQPADIVTELNSVFGTSGESGVIRFIPNDRLNSVLVITARPNYLRRAENWIRKLDRIAGASDSQLFVYEIQNRPAQELAQVLQRVLSTGSTGTRGSVQSAAVPANAVAPDLDEALVGQLQAASFDGAGASVDATATQVVADTENNALLISTTEREYRLIEQILRQLDVLPTQVMLEAVIAEVTLNDELKFGVRWAIESGSFSFGLSDLASGFAGAAFPGASWGYTASDIQVTLNALASITDVNVISSPTVMALNNQEAVLQVGDQVPIVTQQATNTVTTNAPVVNSVTLKDTGIILRVLPRVNASGRVLLDIEQEVSSVTETTTSGIDSPTIQQRRIQTKVAVNDGESLALGGLIQERNSLQRGQVPILGDIPILGNAFKNKTDSISRTELIIFIRPRVVTNVHEARRVTDEFRRKLGFNSAIEKRRGGTPLQQDLRRIAY